MSSDLSLKDRPRRGGSRNLTVLVYHSLKRSLGIHLYRIYSNSTEQLSSPPSAHDGALTTRQLTTDEVERFARDPELQIDASAIECLRKHNHLCFGALFGDTLAASTWLSFTTAPHIHGVAVEVRSPKCYGYKAFTRPRYRGQLIWPVLARVAISTARQLGCDELLSFIEIDNSSSLAAADKIGARRVGFAGFIRCFGRCFPFNSPGAKRAGFRFVYQPAPAECQKRATSMLL